MKERLVIIIVALIAGLFITSAGFFIYQSTKNSETAKPIAKTAQKEKTDATTPTLFVKVTEPTDESLTDKRTMEVKGSTNPGNIIVVSTNSEDVTGQSTTDGNFSITIDIDAGANEIITRSIAPDGEVATDTRTVTYSTDEF